MDSLTVRGHGLTTRMGCEGYLTEDLKLASEAVDAYSRYRRPEAAAMALGFQAGLLTPRFNGPFCLTCVVYMTGPRVSVTS
ncbi:MAG: hypothetical protein QW057_03285 [Candidatus Bathyarchaeia archaeon]